MKADRKRRAKLLRSWSEEVIAALVCTGGKELPAPSPTEENVDKVYVDFLMKVVDEIRKVPGRMNNALDA